MVTHLQAIVQVKNEVSNSGTFSVVPRSFNANVNAGLMVEWIVRLLCNLATYVRSGVISFTHWFRVLVSESVVIFSLVPQCYAIVQ